MSLLWNRSVLEVLEGVLGLETKASSFALLLPKPQALRRADDDWRLAAKGHRLDRDCGVSTTKRV